MDEKRMTKCLDGCRREDPTVKVWQDECDSCLRPVVGPTLCDACAVKYGRTKLASDLRPEDRV